MKNRKSWLPMKAIIWTKNVESFSFFIKEGLPCKPQFLMMEFAIPKKVLKYILHTCKELRIYIFLVFTFLKINCCYPMCFFSLSFFSCNLYFHYWSPELFTFVLIPSFCVLFSFCNAKAKHHLFLWF